MSELSAWKAGAWKWRRGNVIPMVEEYISDFYSININMLSGISG